MAVLKMALSSRYAFAVLVALIPESRRHRKLCRCAPATGLCVGTPARHRRALAAACRRSHDPSSACGGTAGPIFLGSDCPARGHRPLQSAFPAPLHAAVGEAVWHRR